MKDFTSLAGSVQCLVTFNMIRMMMMLVEGLCLNFDHLLSKDQTDHYDDDFQEREQ